MLRKYQGVGHNHWDFRGFRNKWLPNNEDLKYLDAVRHNTARQSVPRPYY
jgi:hypothetical protein